MSEAEESLQKRDFKTAATLLERAIIVDPDSRNGLEARYKLGFVMETYLNDPRAALISFKSFVESSRDSLRVYEVKKRMARIYLDTIKDPVQGKDFYEKLIQDYPESLEKDFLLFQLGKAHFLSNEFEQCRQRYQQLIDQMPRSQYVVRARYEIGNTYYMEGRYDVAVQAFEQVLRNHSQSKFAIEAQFLMAHSLAQIGKQDEALSAYQGLLGVYQPEALLQRRISELKAKSRRGS